MTVIPVKKLDKTVDTAMLEWLSPLGFGRAGPGGVERWRGNRYDFLGCVVNRVGGENHVRPFGQMGFGHIQRVYSHFMSDDPAESNKIAVDVQLRYANFMKSWTAALRCQHEEELQEFLAKLRSFVMDELYPALMSYSTPEQVLALYINKNEKSPTDFDPPVWSGYNAASALTGLILARLHGEENYVALKRRYSGELADLDVDTTARATRLIGHLDQPDPLPELPLRAAAA
jgi:hypothetical protein